MKNKRFAAFAFAVYLIALVYLLLLRHRTPDVGLAQYVRENTNLIPFFSFYVYFTTPYISYRVTVPFLIGTVGNILLLIPWGIMLPALSVKMRKPKEFFVLTVLTVVCVEIAQLLLRVGVCDIEDLLLNTLGAAIGFWLSPCILKRTD